MFIGAKIAIFRLCVQKKLSFLVFIRRKVKKTAKNFGLGGKSSNFAHNN